MKQKYMDVYEFDDDKRRLNFKVLEKWLSKVYWSLKIKADEIKKGSLNSTTVVGCYSDSEQVGFLRVVSDKTRFAYIMDVYVDEAHRKKGIAKNMVSFAITNPELKDVYQWVLATKCEHSIYKKVGFVPLPNPEKWMIFKKEKIRH